MNGVSTCLLCAELICMFSLGVLLIFECSTSVFYPNPCKCLEISSSYAPLWLPHVLTTPGTLGNSCVQKPQSIFTIKPSIFRSPTISRLISHTSSTWGLNPRGLEVTQIPYGFLLFLIFLKSCLFSPQLRASLGLAEECVEVWEPLSVLTDTCSPFSFG